jgi:hypothetical protein
VAKLNIWSLVAAAVAAETQVAAAGQEALEAEQVLPSLRKLTP